MINTRKKGFTLVEVLIASTILSMVTLAGIGIIRLMSSTLFDGQLESSNRGGLNDLVYYISREIQSAEAIKVSQDGKSLKIKQHGGDDYTLVYEVKRNYLAFKGKPLLDLEYEESSFSCQERGIKITLALYKNHININQIPHEISFVIYPRSFVTVLEVTDT